MSKDWNPVARLAFRFGVVYLTLFALATQLSGSVISNLWFTYRGLGRLWPMRDVTHWVGRTVFGIDAPLDDVSGGETVFFWIQWSWVLAAAIVVTAVWALLARGAEAGSATAARRRSDDSILDRRSAERAKTALPWFRLAVRLALAASLLEYGMTKVIPTQFPAPPLTALVTPVGEMTLSALLWTTIGSAPAYQVITGCVEVLAGVLLILPWTATLGALLGLVSLLQVLLLNLTFDIGVKLVTMHLIALAGILLAPVARPLAAVMVRVPRTDSFRLKPEATSNRVAIAAQVAFGVYLLCTLGYINWNFWQVGGGGQPKSILYGIWTVERLSVDDEVRPAELNDYDRRWRRVIFDEPDTLIIQRTDDSFARYGASFDRGRGVMTLTKGGGQTWTSRLAFDRSADDRLMLDGAMDGHRIEAHLRLVEPSAFPLLNSGFRWVRPHDP